MKSMICTTFLVLFFSSINGGCHPRATSHKPGPVVESIGFEAGPSNCRERFGTGLRFFDPTRWPNDTLLEEVLKDEWKHLTFSSTKPTTYSFEGKDDDRFIRAKSQGSGSMIHRRVAMNITRTPRIQWCWRPHSLVEGERLARKSGDDLPARLHLGFAGDWKKANLFERGYAENYKETTGHYPPATVIQYVWSKDQAPGTVIKSAYRPKRVHMIVAESGHKNLGKWTFESHSIAEDYRRAFGKDPPELIFIGIMTDTDNTDGACTTDYGPIVFTK